MAPRWKPTSETRAEGTATRDKAERCEGQPLGARCCCTSGPVRPSVSMTTASQWNSLEAVKLAVAVLTPLLLVGLGVVINRAARRVEEAQWAGRKLVERRLELYDTMAPLLNDLYCFFECVGTFREVEPPKAIEIKRELDKTFYVNRFLFAAPFSERYNEFMAACFKTFTGFGENAKLRAPVSQQKRERGTGWDNAWAALFVPEDELPSSGPERRSDFTASYTAFMECFADQLGIGASASAKAGHP